MTVSTQGLEIKTPSRALQSAIELLSSMRFSISLLTVICIASVIGTVLKQGEAFTNYVNQFGPFWAQVFSAAGLYAVYSAWWFLLILAFLVTSTSLCIARNTPKIIADLKTFKENIRSQSLQAFGHKAQAVLNETPEAAAQRMGSFLGKSGWRVKLQPREDGIMLAAKAGSANKLGYIAAHSAIVLVCLGGLLDGDLIVRAQMWLGDKQAYTGGGMLADVPAQHRLGVANPTFRANLLVAEGARSGTALLSQPKGVLLQDLPFDVELKKFIVEYYSTGMPKLFASEIVIHDKETGEKKEVRVEVNHPAHHQGVDIYQSSFDDGGSSVKLRAIPMHTSAKAFELDGVMGNSTDLSNGAEKLTLEYTALRVINVENFGKKGSDGAVDVRKVDLRSSIDERLGAANKTTSKKELRNVGPSITYKLRDSAGQAREFHNYMLPVDMGDGAPVFLLGMRDTPQEAFRYLRVPADDSASMDGFMQLRAALSNAGMREQAVKRYAARVIEPGRTDVAQQLENSALRALGLFAGAEKIKDDSKGGLQAISDFLAQNVPEAEREKASDVLIRILNGTLFELAQITREHGGQKPLPNDEKTQSFMTQAVLSLSDAAFYPAPMAFALKDFKQVQASVFQVARAPGQKIVYLGCVLLILGVFAMLYVRERRIWVWLSPSPQGSAASMALSGNRKMMDTDKEFDLLRTHLLQLSAPTVVKVNA